MKLTSQRSWGCCTAKIMNEVLRGRGSHDVSSSHTHKSPAMKLLPLACLLLSSSSKRVTAFALTFTKTNLVRTMSTSLAAKPFSVVVHAEIKSDRMDEFLELIEANAIASRQEPGCLRFGTYRNQRVMYRFTE